MSFRQIGFCLKPYLNNPCKGTCDAEYESYGECLGGNKECWRSNEDTLIFDCIYKPCQISTPALQTLKQNQEKCLSGLKSKHIYQVFKCFQNAFNCKGDLKDKFCTDEEMMAFSKTLTYDCDISTQSCKDEMTKLLADLSICDSYEEDKKYSTCLDEIKTQHFTSFYKYYKSIKECYAEDPNWSGGSGPLLLIYLWILIIFCL